MMMPEGWGSASSRPGRQGKTGKSETPTLLRKGPGQAAKIRQLRERYVHAERARAATPFRDAFGERCGQRRAIDQRAIQQLWIEIRDHRAGADRIASLGDDAHRPALLDDHLAHRGIEADLRAMRGR